jgi:membrane protease subunit HflK
MGRGDKGGWQGGDGPWGRPPKQPERDPFGGGSGGGPTPPGGPDFDEWMKKTRDQFQKYFPEGQEGGKGFILIVVIALLLWLSSGIYFVGPDAQGVVLRFGAYHRTVGSGLNYHLPYPFESAETPKVTTVNRVEIGYRSAVSSRSRTVADSGDEGLMLTGDENIIDITFEVQWKIASAPDFLFNVRYPEETVKAVSESAMREIIGKTQIATVLAEGKLQVEQDTKKLIQQTLDEYKAGVEVVTVNLLKADPPQQVIDAFRDVQTARADMETARNQADAYRNDILPKARGQAQQMILEAEAYKQEVIARAQGEAARFSSVYNEFKLAKDITKKRMYLETMEEILQGMNKVIVDGKNTQGVMPYLPLKELKPAAGDSQ